MSSAPPLDPRAIGIFDSGLGGMTVARAVRQAFPREPICYLGDTARVPYGTKSPATVRQYAREIIAFLRQRSVKVIIAACNTVSAAALPDLDGAYDVPVIGVVEMGAEAACGAGILPDPKVGQASRLSSECTVPLRDRRDACPTLSSPRRIGVIGTETTIASDAYARAIHRRAPDAAVIQKACPLFVPLIEEGWNNHRVTSLVIEEYLAPMRSEGIDTLILGCTHYPLIRPALGEFFGPSVRLVDSAEAVVRALGDAFDTGAIRRAQTAVPDSTDRSDRSDRAATSAARAGSGEPGRAKAHYYVTDRSNRFRDLVAAFMGEPDLAVEQISSDALTEALAQTQ